MEKSQRNEYIHKALYFLQDHLRLVPPHLNSTLKSNLVFPLIYGLFLASLNATLTNTGSYQVCAAKAHNRTITVIFCNYYIQSKIVLPLFAYSFAQMDILLQRSGFYSCDPVGMHLGCEPAQMSYQE